MEIKYVDREKLNELINEIHIILFIDKTLIPRKYIISNRYNYNDLINKLIQDGDPAIT